MDDDDGFGGRNVFDVVMGAADRVVHGRKKKEREEVTDGEAER